MGKKRTKRGRKKSASFNWGLILIGFVLGFAAAFVVLKYGVMVSAPPDMTASVKEAGPPHKEPLPAGKVSSPAAKVAILIDDMGGSITRLNEILSIGSPITISVLPHLKHSREVSRIAALSGHDVLVHLPMEPKNSAVNHAGRGVLLTAMTGPLITKTVIEDLQSVPDAIGANNHMGSRFTENEAGMRTVFTVLKERGLFFVDSRTTSASIGPRLAADTGIRHAERDVFLDNERDVNYIDGQLKILVDIARKRGSAIAIGHPYPETLAALQEMIPLMEASAIEVVPVSELIR
ncbi:MAG: divergent polysaccharide deacetylase family protein [Thermodesulfobacteriota bacterium]